MPLQEQNFTPKPGITKIDIRALFASKKSKFIHFIPGFVISYLEKLIHQDEINDILRDFKDDTGLDFIENLFIKFGVIIQVAGAENLNPEGHYLFASNHPLGGLDGLALMQTAGKINPNIVFPVNDLLMNLPNLKPLFIPVNKHGSNVQNVKIIDDTFASDKWILFFPAGLCSRKQKGKILDLEWKKSFITKAKNHNRDIVPVHINGRNSNFFYNLANIRKFLGIKANIEMIYLPDEMFRQKDKVLKIQFGKPVSWTVFDKRMNDKQWAGLFKTHVYQLGQGVDDFDSLINPEVKKKIIV